MTNTTAKTVDSEFIQAFHDAFHESCSKSSGLKSPKPVALDHRWIWDKPGSELFEGWRAGEPYYLTDSEELMLRRHGNEIAKDVEALVDLGSGTADKALLLLREMTNPEFPVGYYPVDVSPYALRATRAQVVNTMKGVEVTPTIGNFEEGLAKIKGVERHKLVAFFGSTIGNYNTLADTVDFLKLVKASLNPGDRFLLGADLIKPDFLLNAAYNQGEVCRAFFANMVTRINKECGATFSPDDFRMASHIAEGPDWNGITDAWIQFRVVPNSPQSSHVESLGHNVILSEQTPLDCGISRKFIASDIEKLGDLADFPVTNQWVDSSGDVNWFSLTEFTA